MISGHEIRQTSRTESINEDFTKLPVAQTLGHIYTLFDCKNYFWQRTDIKDIDSVKTKNLTVAMKNLLITLLLFSAGCTIKSITPTDGLEVNMDFDLSSLDMRHGWAFLTLPQKTQEFENDSDSIARGKTLYAQHCQKCHGEKGLGDGPMAKNLVNKPANLSNLSKGLSNTYLVVQINNGRGEMPKWQDFLNTKQTWDLTHFIRTLKDSKP